MRLPNHGLCTFNVPQLNCIDATLQEMSLNLTRQLYDGV